MLTYEQFVTASNKLFVITTSPQISVLVGNWPSKVSLAIPCMTLPPQNRHFSVIVNRLCIVSVFFFMRQHTGVQDLTLRDVRLELDPILGLGQLLLCSYFIDRSFSLFRFFRCKQKIFHRNTVNPNVSNYTGNCNRGMGCFREIRRCSQ